MCLPAYADVHIPRALVEGLRGRGMDVLTAIEDGTDLFDDQELLQRSASLGRVLLTQDTDFFSITDDWRKSDQRFVCVIVLMFRRNRPNEQFLDDVELVLRAADISNQVFVLPF